MKNTISRRTFIGAGALAGTAALFPAGLHAKQNSTTVFDNAQVFLFQGDSITDGNRGRNTDPNHVMGHGYAFAVASRIGADFPAAGYQFYNRGVSGNTIRDLQNRWQTDTLDIKPGILSILVGINDAAASVENKPGAQTAAAFEDGYRQLLNEATSACPGIILILGVPFVFAVGKRKDNWDAWKAATAERAAAVQKLAKEFNAVQVDYPLVFEKAITKAPADYWIWDGIHPTVPGHELMAREWIKQAGSRLPFLKKYHY